MSEMRELVINEEEIRDFLLERLRLEGKSAEALDKLSLPFLFASGSELLRTYILNASGFASTLPDRYKIPQRGYVWYMFSQAVREIEVRPKEILIRYELQDSYMLPFRQFYL